MVNLGVLRYPQVKKLNDYITQGEICLKQVEKNKLNNRNSNMGFIFDQAKKAIENNINYWQEILVRVSEHC